MSAYFAAGFDPEVLRNPRRPEERFDLGDARPHHRAPRPQRLRKIDTAEDRSRTAGGGPGAVHFKGRAYLRPRLRQLAARGLFYLPVRDLFSRRLTIRDQIAAIEWRAGGSERTSEVLRFLDVTSLIDRPATEVSGGERRRLEVAAAMIRSPECLLADEPFTEIAPRDAELIGEALRHLAAEGAAIVITGHEVSQILQVADDVVWMVAGTTHGLGSVADAREHAQFRHEYLGTKLGQEA